ncbi:MAG TPA: hypothetical protein VL358_09500 [Caulobacteraceae bacterium]|nr:hypothetical protein [Caulobacteraceae bacterium]
MNQPFNYAPWVQIGVSVLTIAASIGTAYWLQNRAFERQSRSELKVQVAALIAIAGRAEAVLVRLDKRAASASFKKEELGWLESECEALQATVGGIDLMSIKDSALISHIAELQEAARTGCRRLGWAASHVRKDQPVKTDQFDDPLRRAQRALKGFGDYKLPKTLA